MSNDFPIEPGTKVAALLDHYPKLEDVLIEMAPPFKKLRNPILRKSVAKVASLRQAAAVGRIPVDELVNRLRASVGQPQTGGTAQVSEEHGYFADQPEWFDEGKVVETIVESDLAPDVMPLTPLLRRTQAAQAGEIVELVTTYLPAPGIDIMKEKGFEAWSVERGELVKTYFCRPVRRPESAGPG
ncbi:MAG: DUF1858 domain-containing protein [bacterium]|nr:DUF1858 domain-containing protein [bacterium]